MVEMEDLIGNLAVFTTIGLFLSGMTICYEIFKKKNVGDISHIPFLCAAINTYLNFIYGYLIENDKVMIVNIIGLVLEVAYMIVYVFFYQNKAFLFKQLTASLFALIGIHVFVFKIEEESLFATNVMGYFASIASVVMFASPLANLKLVMLNKNTESLSFPLCMSTLACSSLWAFYALIIGDYFIFTPNILGALLGAIQVSLFYKFHA